MFDVKPAYPLSLLHDALKGARVLAAREVMALSDVRRISNEKALTEIVTSRLAHNAAYVLVRDSIVDRAMTKTDHGFEGIEYRLNLAVMPASTWRSVQNLLAGLVEAEALQGEAV